MILALCIIAAYLIVGYFVTDNVVVYMVRKEIEGGMPEDIATDSTSALYIMGILLWPIAAPIGIVMAWADGRKVDGPSPLTKHVRRRVNKNG